LPEGLKLEQKRTLAQKMLTGLKAQLLSSKSIYFHSLNAIKRGIYFNICNFNFANYI